MCSISSRLGPCTGPLAELRRVLKAGGRLTVRATALPAARVALARPPPSGRGRRAVAVVGPGAVGVGHGGGAVGVEGDGPAPLVDDDEVVERAEQDQFGEFGAAALAS